MEKICKRLNEAIKLRNLKPIDLSNKTGIDKGSISSYLSGRYLPKSKNIYKMAKALNVNPSWLLGYDVPMEPENSKDLGNNENDNLDSFLNNIKYDEIDNIVKKDKQKKIISYINFYDIVLNLFPNNMHSIEKEYENINETVGLIEYLNQKIEDSTLEYPNIELESKISKKDLEESIFFAKKIKLLYCIKKYYNEDDILSEIDNRHMFNIIDKNDNPITNKRIRLDAIKYFIEKSLNEISSNNNSKRKEKNNQSK